MVMDVVQLRKRRCGPKVKTGCGTCKIRRVKCDETKPSCQRCSSTGRNCDGYGGSGDMLNRIPKNTTSVIQHLSVHISGTMEEKRGFDYFLRNTAAELSGYFDSSFWEKLILAASAQSSSLRHAVVAIGTLHEDFTRKTPDFPQSPTENPTARFAWNQYVKAVMATRKSLAGGQVEPLIVLMNSILFVCFDSLRGWYESAMIHLQGGLQILQEMMRSPIRDHNVETEIIPLFVRLSIQVIIYLDTKSTHNQASFARRLMDISRERTSLHEEFQTLKEARNSLDLIISSFFGATQMWDGNLPLALQPPESLIILEGSMSQLSIWKTMFKCFMMSNGKVLTKRDIQAAALLQIHYSTVKIISGVHSDRGDSKTVTELEVENFSNCSDDFQIVLDLSTSLITAAEQDARSGKPSLTFRGELGLIGPLYYLCINCPAASMRKKAMELLVRCPRREGMWDSVMIAQMIRQHWDLEARHEKVQQAGAGAGDDRVPMPFKGEFDRGSAHFDFFGQAPDLDVTDASFWDSKKS